jgi:hypothetical protein
VKWNQSQYGKQETFICKHFTVDRQLNSFQVSYVFYICFIFLGLSNINRPTLGHFRREYNQAGTPSLLFWPLSQSVLIEIARSSTGAPTILMVVAILLL